MWKEILDFTLNAIKTMGDWWTWLNTPLLIGQEWLTPLSIIGAGFLVVIGLWIFKLVNPFH